MIADGAEREPMMTFLENAGLIVMLVVAATAVIKFRARRYLLILITGTAAGAWLIGYAFGARSTAEIFYPLVPDNLLAQAEAIVEPVLLSPLWGLALGVLIILLDHIAFGTDVRKFADRRRNQSPRNTSEHDSTDEDRPNSPVANLLGNRP